MTNLSWNATETENIEPFADAGAALEGTMLRLSPDDDFDATELRVFESDVKWDLAQPELHISVDAKLAVDKAKIVEDELAVGIVIRDRELNRFALARQWVLDEVPDQPVPLANLMSEFSRSMSIDFFVYLFTGVTKDRGVRIAGRRGEVVARKGFKVRLMSRRSKFPRVWKHPDDFVEIGLPRDTLFCIEWLVEDLNTPPRDAFVVWLNEYHKEQIKSFELGGASGHLLSSSLSAAIFADIAAPVLFSEQEPDDPVGLIQIIADVLGNVSGHTLEEMRLRAGRHTGFSYIRAWTQDKLGVGDRMQSLTFLGKRT